MNKDIEKEFDEELTASFQGDSGYHGNDPQEPVYEMSCEPEDIKAFIDKHFIARKDMVREIENNMFVYGCGGQSSDCGSQSANKALQDLQNKLL